jgi:hypothetical protein
MLKNKICVELNNSLKEIQQTLINTIESPVRGDYNIYMRHKKIQNNIKEINEIKKEIFNKCY